MPTFPIYVPLLPKAVQRVIGKVHKNSEPALHFLREEGFDFTGRVDIFDAGPLLKARVEAVRTVRQCRKGKIAGLVPEVEGERDCLLANPSLDFRACLGRVEERKEGRVRITKRCGELLSLDCGDTLVHAPLTRRFHKSSG